MSTVIEMRRYRSNSSVAVNHDIALSIMILLICHPKVCSKFQGELAITESDEDYKRCDMYIIMCVCLTY